MFLIIYDSKTHQLSVQMILTSLFYSRCSEERANISCINIYVCGVRSLNRMEFITFTFRFKQLIFLVKTGIHMMDFHS